LTLPVSYQNVLAQPVIAGSSFMRYSFISGVGYFHLDVPGRP